MNGCLSAPEPADIHLFFEGIQAQVRCVHELRVKPSARASRPPSISGEPCRPSWGGLESHDRNWGTAAITRRDPRGRRRTTAGARGWESAGASPVQDRTATREAADVSRRRFRGPVLGRELAFVNRRPLRLAEHGTAATELSDVDHGAVPAVGWGIVLHTGDVAATPKLAFAIGKVAAHGRVKPWSGSRDRDERAPGEPGRKPGPGCQTRRRARRGSSPCGFDRPVQRRSDDAHSMPPMPVMIPSGTAKNTNSNELSGVPTTVIMAVPSDAGRVVARPVGEHEMPPRVVCRLTSA